MPRCRLGARVIVKGVREAGALFQQPREPARELCAVAVEILRQQLVDRDLDDERRRLRRPLRSREM